MDVNDEELDLIQDALIRRRNLSKTVIEFAEKADDWDSVGLLLARVDEIDDIIEKASRERNVVTGITLTKSEEE